MNWKLIVASSFEFCASFITFNGDPVLDLLDTVTFMRYFASFSERGQNWVMVLSRLRKREISFRRNKLAKLGKIHFGNKLAKLGKIHFGNKLTKLGKIHIGNKLAKLGKIHFGNRSQSSIFKLKLLVIALKKKWSTRAL